VIAAADAVGILSYSAFGLWWLLLPRSVIRFYAWFHKGQGRAPTVGGVRLAGALWCIIVVTVSLMQLGR
jgi:hypothetical protein